MSFGVWFMIITSFAILFGYLVNRHYANKFTFSAFYTQMLDQDSNHASNSSKKSNEVFSPADNAIGEKSNKESSESVN